MRINDSGTTTAIVVTIPVYQNKRQLSNMAQISWCQYRNVIQLSGYDMPEI